MTQTIYEINEGWDVGSGSDGRRSGFTEETTWFYRFEEGEEARGDPRAAFCGRTERFRLRNRAVKHGRAAGRVLFRCPRARPLLRSLLASKRTATSPSPGPGGGERGGAAFPHPLTASSGAGSGGRLVPVPCCRPQARRGADRRHRAATCAPRPPLSPSGRPRVPAGRREAARRENSARVTSGRQRPPRPLPGPGAGGQDIPGWGGRPGG